MHRLLIAITLALLGFTEAAPPPPGLSEDLLTATNQARFDNGVPPVRWGRTLAVAAQGHAEEMARLDYFGHVGPTPGRRTLGERLAWAGDPALRAAENLALYSDREELAAAVVQGWLDSPSHRAALLDAGFTHVGFGAARGAGDSVYVVQVFAWRPWQYQEATVAPQGRRLLVELRYDLPLEGVRAFVDGRPAQTFLRGDRVVVVVEAGGRELMLGSDRGEEVVLFDAFTLDASGHLRPGQASGNR